MNVICYNFETNLELRTYFVADIGQYLFFCDFSDVVFFSAFIVDFENLFVCSIGLGTKLSFLHQFHLN